MIKLNQILSQILFINTSVFWVDQAIQIKKNISKKVLFKAMFLSMIMPQKQNIQAAKPFKIQNMSDLQREIIQLNSIFAQQKNDQTVVIIGNSGAGKSTLLNYLIGIELKIEEYKASSYRLIADSPNACEIGHGSSSKTSKPNCRNFNGVTYWDCPGFLDTKGPLHQIYNQLAIHKVFNSTKKIKIVLVVNDISIKSQNDRGNAIVTLFKRVSEIFQKKDIKKVAENLILVVTKGHQSSTQNVLSQLELIVQGHESMHEDSNTKLLMTEFISSLKKVNSKMIFFKKVNKIDDLPNKQSILKAVSSVEYSNFFNISPVLTPSAQIYLQKFTQESNKQIKIKIDSIASQICKHYENQLKNIKVDKVKIVQKKIQILDYQRSIQNLTQNFKNILFELIDKLIKEKIIDLCDNILNELKSKLQLIDFYQKIENHEIKHIPICIHKLHQQFHSLYVKFCDRHNSFYKEELFSIKMLRQIDRKKAQQRQQGIRAQYKQKDLEEKLKAWNQSYESKEKQIKQIEQKVEQQGQEIYQQILSPIKSALKTARWAPILVPLLTIGHVVAAIPAIFGNKDCLSLIKKSTVIQLYEQYSDQYKKQAENIKQIYIQQQSQKYQLERQKQILKEILSTIQHTQKELELRKKEIELIKRQAEFANQSI